MSRKFLRCVAFCPAESYKISAIAVAFRAQGYAIRAFRKVLCVSHPDKPGYFFIFSYGCLVTWGLSRISAQQLLEQLQPFAVNVLVRTEIAKFVYCFGESTEIASHERFNIDILTLESDSMQLKLAISYGIAQSIQLESYESAVQKTIEENAHFPQQLARRGAILLSQKAISKKMGEIFLARSSINLNSEYLAVPDYFWEHSSLEEYYHMSAKFLDITNRVAALNQKLDVLHELFEILTGQLQHQHSSILEIVVICLIFSEIVISLFVIR